MKKNLVTIILTASLLGGCTTFKQQRYNKEMEVVSQSTYIEESKKKKGLLDYTNDLLTGWLPGYGIIRFGCFEKNRK